MCTNKPYKTVRFISIFVRITDGSKRKHSVNYSCNQGGNIYVIIRSKQFKEDLYN